MLIYLSDLAISVMNQYIHSPYKEYMEVVCQILGYIKWTQEQSPFLRKREKRSVEAFTIADCTGSAKDKRPTTEYCTFCVGQFSDMEEQETNNGG